MFGDCARDYSVVFTCSATAGLKLIGESFPFDENSEFRYQSECHTSVLGMREYALNAGSTVSVVRFGDPSGSETTSKFRRERNRVPVIIDQTHTQPSSQSLNLFIGTAESNFSGRKTDLRSLFDLNSSLSENRATKWVIGIDASAFLSNGNIDLKSNPFDFVVFSFYKIFGYPTGIGALILRNGTMRSSLSYFFRLK